MSRLFLSIIVSCLLLTACGHKSPVVPLGDKLPVAPGDLTALQRGNAYLLSWQLPKINQDGSNLQDLIGFDLLRMDFDSATPCSTCRDTSRQIGYVDLEYLQDANRSGDRFFVENRGIDVQRAYRYHVIAVNADKRRGQPASLDVTALQPPSPPVELSGEGLDRLVRLSWTAAEDGLPDDATLAGYLIFRAEGANPFPLQPLSGELTKETRYEDLGVANEAALRYAVRTVINLNGQQLQSTLSEAISVTPHAGL